jgi:thymidylate synthase (FAD)
MYKSKLNIINPSFEIINVGKTQIEILKTLESDARKCYKSEDKITDTSYYNFIKGILKRNHEAMIEHAYLVFGVSNLLYQKILLAVGSTTHYFAFSHCNNRNIISANIRTLRDLHRDFKIADITNYLLDKFPVLFEDLPKLESQYTERDIWLIWDFSDFNHEERLKHIFFSVSFICNRGFSHEMVRMRKKWSYAQVSTRYVDAVMKSGNFTVIRPLDYISRTKECYRNLNPLQKIIHLCKMIRGDNYRIWIHDMKNHEKDYVRMRNNKAPAQIARGVLPIDLQTEIVCSNTLENWVHTLELRTHPSAHPSMYQLQRQVLRILKAKYPKEFEHIPDYDMEVKLICKYCKNEFVLKSRYDLIMENISEQMFSDSINYAIAQNELINEIYENPCCINCYREWIII